LAIVKESNLEIIREYLPCRRQRLSINASQPEANTRSERHIIGILTNEFIVIVVPAIVLASRVLIPIVSGGSTTKRVKRFNVDVAVARTINRRFNGSKVDCIARNFDKARSNSLRVICKSLSCIPDDIRRRNNIRK
jgi:hypothetical protein